MQQKQESRKDLATTLCNVIWYFQKASLVRSLVFYMHIVTIC